VCCADPDGKDCLPVNTYVDCGDCSVVKQKYLETVCSMQKILPLWQWILIVCGAVLAFIVLMVIVCCCCCKSGKGPQSIEDEEWLLVR
jgi:hypothetical protein